MQRLGPLLALMLATACATTRSSPLSPVNLTVSDSSRVVSAGILPDAERSPRLVNHLALAEELYQRKLAALQERRDVVRSRARTFNAMSFAVFAGSAIGVGALSISGAAQNDAKPTDTLRQSGYLALGGLATGTLLQVLGYMQEDPSSIDAKAQRLQAAHARMLERLRSLSAAAAPPKDGQPASGVTGVELLMSDAIESFMAEATQINVQG